MARQMDADKTGSKPQRGRKYTNPIRVLKPVVMGPVDRMRRFLGRFGIVVALTIGVLFLPTPAGLSAEGHRALAAFVFTAGVLALEPVSLPIAALMVPVALVALGVAAAPQAFETFSRPVVFLILGMAAVLWVGGPFIESMLGFPRTLFSSAVVAVIHHRRGVCTGIDHALR